MKIIDILFLIYLLLVLASVVFISIVEKSPLEGAIIYMPAMIFMIFINYLILGIFNINYLNSNDNTLKRIINILIGLSPIIFVLGLILDGDDISATGGEKFNNIKTPLMQKILTKLNIFINK